VTEIRRKLDTSVVQPIFGRVKTVSSLSQVLPEVVLHNRQKRAHERILDALTSRGFSKITPELRSNLESMVDAWNAQAFDDAFRPIQEFEIQCARNRNLAAAAKSGDLKQLLALRESEYRQRVAERYGSIELRGIQVNHRVILDLEKVYVPLHLDEVNHPITATLEGANPRRGILDVLQEHRQILVLGPPGSGKSTLVSFLARLAAIGPQQNGWPARVLPFVITVRQIKDADLTPEWLATQVGLELEIVVEALSEQRALILVDGLDEAPETLRSQLAKSVVSFVKSNSKVPFVITSRPAGAPGTIMSGLNGFWPSQLASFTELEVNAFVDKWCLAAEESTRSDHAAALNLAAAAASDLKSRISRSGPVKRIAANPLLTTILCVVHRFLGKTIPEHRITLYEKCTDALLYEWDRAKFPKDAAVGDLDANQKRVLLRRIASALHESHEAEMAEQEVVRHFSAVLPHLARPAEDAQRILDEIRDRTGLLVERRPGMFAFSHLTFQEYFTALEYAGRSESLFDHLDDPWWHEVIALTAGSPGSNPDAIIRALLARKGDIKSIVLATKCLETAVKVPLELRKEVEGALQSFMPPATVLDLMHFAEIGLTVAPIFARELLTYPPNGVLILLLFFVTQQYEPVVPILVGLAADARVGTLKIADGVKQNKREARVRDVAVRVLREMSLHSESAKRGLLSVLPSLRRPFLKSLNLEEIFGNEFTTAHPGKHSPKRAGNTVSKRRNTLSPASR